MKPDAPKRATPATSLLALEALNDRTLWSDQQASRPNPKAVKAHKARIAAVRESMARAQLHGVYQ